MKHIIALIALLYGGPRLWFSFYKPRWKDKDYLQWKRDFVLQHAADKNRFIRQTKGIRLDDCIHTAYLLQLFSMHSRWSHGREIALVKEVKEAIHPKKLEKGHLYFDGILDGIFTAKGREFASEILGLELRSQDDVNKFLDETKDLETKVALLGITTPVCSLSNEEKNYIALNLPSLG